MEHYITGAAIRALREQRHMTQAQLAGLLCVSDKTISKWETCRGLPDLSLLEPLAGALHVSVPELLSGEQIINRNRGANFLRTSLYVCPVCGNVLHAAGEAAISCCGVALPPLEAEEPDEAHALQAEELDGEYVVSLPHDMSKTHFISWMARSAPDRFELVKLYPEGACQARFPLRGTGNLYWYCNRHGLFRQKLSHARPAGTQPARIPPDPA